LTQHKVNHNERKPTTIPGGNISLIRSFLMTPNNKKCSFAVLLREKKTKNKKKQPTSIGIRTRKLKT